MMSAISPQDRISIRPATDDDFEGIIALGVECLGWNGDQRDREFFRWKHHENPFGRSPAWVAEVDGRLAGFRTFMRWRFVHGTSGETLEMVRAVDTATHPDFQGRGIFRDLTLSAIEEMTAQGIDAVFNTPNDKSRPGYLKMGWAELGRPTIRLRPSSPARLRRVASASRAPAELWPETPGSGVDGGLLPEHVFPTRATWRTDRPLAFRDWRYRFAALGYQHASGRGGGSVYRLRRRGNGRELTLCEVHGTGPGLGAEVRAQADYTLAVGRSGGPALGIPVPRRGPVVTWRGLRATAAPDLRDLDLCLGDLELF